MRRLHLADAVMSCVNAVNKLCNGVGGGRRRHFNGGVLSYPSHANGLDLGDLCDECGRAVGPCGRPTWESASDVPDGQSDLTMICHAPTTGESRLDIIHPYPYVYA